MDLKNLAAHPAVEYHGRYTGMHVQGLCQRFQAQKYPAEDICSVVAMLDELISKVDGNFQESSIAFEGGDHHQCGEENSIELNVGLEEEELMDNMGKHVKIVEAVEQSQQHIELEETVEELEIGGGNCVESSLPGSDVPGQSSPVPETRKSPCLTENDISSSFLSKGVPRANLSSCEIEKMLGQMSCSVSGDYIYSLMGTDDSISATLIHPYKGCRKLIVKLEEGNFSLTETAAEAYCCLCRQAVNVEEIYPHMVFKHLNEKRTGCGFCSFCSRWKYVNTKYDLETEQLAVATWHCLYKKDGSLDRVRDLDVKRSFSATKTMKNVKEEIEDGEEVSRECLSETVIQTTSPGPTSKKRKNKYLSTPTADEKFAKKNSNPRHGKRCQLCKKLVQKPKHHLLIQHLRKPICCCPYCSYSSPHEPGNVHAHILYQHKGEKVYCVNREAYYRKEILELMAKAFPRKRRRDQSVDDQEGEEVEVEGAAEQRKIKGPTVKCKVCQKVVTTSSKRGHVLTNHLKKPLLSCSYCHYSNYGHDNAIKLHIDYKHPGQKFQVTDRTKLFQEQINKWMLECFSVFSGKTSTPEDQKAVGMGNELYSSYHQGSEDDQGVTTFDSYGSKCDATSSGDTLCKKQKLRLSPGKAVFSTIADVKRKNPNYNIHKAFVECKLCEKPVQWVCRRPHILLMHLRKPLIFCPYCQYTNKGNRSAFNMHIDGQHPDQKYEIIDKTSLFQGEIDNLMLACFPGADQFCKVPSEKNWRQESFFGVYSAENDAARSGGETLDKSSKCIYSTEGKVKAFGSRCRLCNYVLTSDSKWKRIRHVQSKHLKKKMYFCPLCAYSDFSKRKKIFQEHFQKIHPNKELEIVDRSGEHEEEMEKMVVECFSKKKKQLKKRGFSQNVIETLRKLAVTEKKQQNEAGDIVPKENSVENEGKRMFCKECQREVSKKSLERHVYHVHIRKLSVFCPYCDFGALYDTEQVEFHIRAVHVGEDVEVVDKRGEMMEEFERVKSGLFA